TAVDRRERHRPPARLDHGAEVGERADLAQAEVAACFDERRLHLVAVLPRSRELQAGYAAHAVAHRAHFAAGDAERTRAEEPYLGQRPAVELLKQLEGVRTLDLVAIEAALTRAIDDPHRVELDAHVIAAALAIELHPVGGRRVADQQQVLLIEVVQDAVADDIALWRAGEELLGRPGSEGLEAVHAEPLEQPQGIPTAHVQVVHVIALIVQRDGFAPRALLVAPGGELRTDHLG